MWWGVVEANGTPPPSTTSRVGCRRARASPVSRRRLRTRVRRGRRLARAGDLPPLGRAALDARAEAVHVLPAARAHAERHTRRVALAQPALGALAKLPRVRAALGTGARLRLHGRRRGRRGRDLL